MNIQPITEKTLCFGIMCPQHAQCARYNAVDGSHPDTQLGSCLDGKEYSLFLLTTKDKL
jgi:hypothetical protein